LDAFAGAVEQKDAAVGVQAAAISVHVAVHLHRGRSGGRSGIRRRAGLITGVVVWTSVPRDDCGNGGRHGDEQRVCRLLQLLEHGPAIHLDARVFEVAALLERMSAHKGLEIVKAPLCEPICTRKGFGNLTLLQLGRGIGKNVAA
jgi:hypothetical protein